VGTPGVWKIAQNKRTIVFEDVDEDEEDKKS
jgi:hypothetical protein